MRRERFPLRPLEGINITNLIDVCMALLIIFMITAPLMRSGLEVDLPKTEAAQPQADAGIVVVLTADAVIYVNEQQVSQKAFPGVLKSMLAGDPNRPVFIKADQAVPYGRVVEMIGQMKEMKVNQVGLVTEPKAGK
jgi:biopolymer transport protein ExbD